MAILDAMGTTSKRKGQVTIGPNRTSGLTFFTGRNYMPYCELVGLNPVWVGEMMKKYAGIECG